MTDIAHRARAVVAVAHAAEHWVHGVQQQLEPVGRPLRCLLLVEGPVHESESPGGVAGRLEADGEELPVGPGAERAWQAALALQRAQSRDRLGDARLEE